MLRPVVGERGYRPRTLCARPVRGRGILRRVAGGVLGPDHAARRIASSAWPCWRRCCRCWPRPRIASRCRVLEPDAGRRGRTTVIAALRFENIRPARRAGARHRDGRARGAPARAHRSRAARGRIRAAPAAHRVPARRASSGWQWPAHRRGADSPADAGVRRAGLARVSRHGRAQRPHAGDRPLGDPRAAGLDAAQSRSLGGRQRGVLGESLGQVGGAPGFPRLPRTLPRQVGPAAVVAALRSRRARRGPRAAGVRGTGALAHRARLRSVGRQRRHRQRPLRIPARSERRHPQDRRLAG